jgi:hypothetical protein
MMRAIETPNTDPDCDVTPAPFLTAGRPERIHVAIGGAVAIATALLIEAFISGDGIERAVVVTAGGLQGGLLASFALLLAADVCATKAARRSRDRGWGPNIREACRSALRDEFAGRIALEREYGRRADEWIRLVRQRLIWWTVGATFFALLGSAVSLARMNAERVGAEGFVTLGGPALGSFLLATCAAACGLGRGQAWQTISIDWKHWAVDCDRRDGPSKSAPLRKPEPRIVPNSAMQLAPVAVPPASQFTQGVQRQEPTTSPPPPPPVWIPRSPPEDDNDAKG